MRAINSYQGLTMAFYGQAERMPVNRYAVNPTKDTFAEQTEAA
jgi:hypothetical protein